MKSIFCIGFIFTIFLSVSFAAVSIGIFQDPKYPGKCAISDNLILENGEEIKDPNEECAQIQCGDNGFAQFLSCGTSYVEGCEQGDYLDKSLPYPECCQRELICKKKN